VATRLQEAVEWMAVRWVASHRVGGKKQRRGWCGGGNYTWAVRWRLCECGGTEVEAKRE